ncbi:MAG: ATP-binding cassette domain-containing protein [Anaerolineae bacterium]|nr:ATP-binding cassette domain-containing protein [Anaerolineae bacterium]NIN93811.1 ATP-binding cassette domain-containing protein [Anaerolineae bacterium]NIQ76846.1 ATP-binding cassette domain-containing protein [Anaerolineae bacterium]
MQAKPEVIRVENLWVHYDGTPVLEDIDLSVYEKDFIGIIGPNGGGKTSLLKVLLGLIPPTRGHIRVLGRSPEEARRFIGYVPQGSEFDHAFPISVWDVAMMGRLGRRGLFHRYTQEDREVVANVLDRVAMLDFRDRQIGQLSGGERQRVYVARALASQPKILLLDEPTASVDTPVVGSIYELLQELNQSVTIILVSHDIGVVSSYVKTIACLNRRLVYHASKEITPEMLEAAYHCPVDLIAHGMAHRVLELHHFEGGQE